MPRYVAFLRAINVGGHVVKMERLRGLFAELGFAKVETFIASGNVIFETRAKTAGALETKIERHLHDALGYEVTTIVRTASGVGRDRGRAGVSVRRDGSGRRRRLHRVSAEKRRAKLLQKLSPDIRARWMHSRFAAARFTGFAENVSATRSFPGRKLEKILGMRMTVRNSTTVRKLAAKLSIAAEG